MFRKKTKNRPLVSVCIPSYNYSNYISSAIESVLLQTYQNFELIIVDDYSTDNTNQIIEKYLTQDKRIQFYKNTSNLGMVENWNLCLKKTTGEYVKILGADDLLERSCLEKSVAVLDENPGVSLVSCARLLIDKDAKPIKTVAYADKFQILAGKQVINNCFFTANLIGEPTAVLFRKKDSLRGFNPSYRQLTDLEMWFSLLEKADFAFIPEALCKFRVHQDQATKSNVQTLTFLDDELLLFRDYLGKDYIGDSFINRQRWKFKLCFTIWSHKFMGLDINRIRSKITQYLPLYLFYPLAYVKLVKDKAVELIRKSKLHSL